jgi:hypothetical protein
MKSVKILIIKKTAFFPSKFISGSVYLIVLFWLIAMVSNQMCEECPIHTASIISIYLTLVQIEGIQRYVLKAVELWG